MAIIKSCSLAAALGLAFVSDVSAGDVEIVDAKASKVGDSWSFSVTLRHGDTGWDHYADQWQVYTASGDFLGSRELAHPHVNEQPFTRSLSGVVVPKGVEEVVIKARDSVHGVAAQEYRLKLQ